MSALTCPKCSTDHDGHPDDTIDAHTSAASRDSPRPSPRP